MDVKVLEKTEDGLEVAVLPHNIPAFLPMAHLSDHVANGPLLYHWLQAGDTLHRVLCLSHSERQVVSFTGIWGSHGKQASHGHSRGKLWIGLCSYLETPQKNVSHLTAEILP